ncbi:unnamed protein product [Auanema sp. JU1783]|nr:unnamed protein product [Auanema sp. JU1783]
MGAFLLTFELFLVFILTSYLLNKYGNWRKQHIVVTLSTFIGWFFSFTIIFVLPLDVAITFYNKCELNQKISNFTDTCEQPDGFVPDDVLLRLWRVVYWTAQALTWIVLPLLQSYSNVGEFTSGARFRSALLNNIIYYGIYAFIFIMLLFYAMIKGVVINSEHLKVILVSASNTWGLFLLVLLLGYGLVELPRSLWHKGNTVYRLNRTYFNIDKLSSEKSEAEDNLKRLYRESRKVLNSLQNEHGKREKAQIILSKFSSEVLDEIYPVRSASEFSGVADVGSVASDKYLVSLHKQVIAAVQTHHRTKTQWESLVSKALFIEDIAKAQLGGRLQPSSKSVIPSPLQHIWYIQFRKPLMRVFAFILSLMTGFILLSECTFFIIHPTLSPAALIMEYAAEHYHYKYTQFVAMGIICYLCFCAYFTVFRLKIYKYYHLDSHKNTDENSLLFSAILLCRLTPPICLNFLGMVHLDSHITMVKDYGVETQFTKLMGHLDVIPILAKGINIYLPICILIFCAANYYRLTSYIMHNLGFDQFITDNEFTQDMMSAGRALVQLERNSMQRAVNRQSREDQRRDPKSPFNRVRRDRIDDDRIPIVAAAADEDLETGLLLDYNDESNFRSQERSPFKQHPSPTNLFDDL